MENKRIKKRLSLQLAFLTFLIIGTILIIKHQHNMPYQHDRGSVFGTFYSITYQCDNDLQKEIEAELKKVDQALSMFNQESIISKVNRNEKVELNEMFLQVITLAQKVSQDTDGAFDITVAPLVNAWGFGFKTGDKPSGTSIDSLMSTVGYKKISLKGRQLFKENKKFIYGALRKGARASEYETSIGWLADAGLICKVPRCTKLASPLSIYEDLSAFKLYALDVGLLGAMANVEASQILLNDNALVEYKGGITEQYVLQQMKSHETNPIYYHTTEDSRLEIDFVIQSDGKPLPIEVKAGGNVRANALTRLLTEHPEQKALRYSLLPYKEQGQMTNIPLYAVR